MGKENTIFRITARKITRQYFRALDHVQNFPTEISVNQAGKRTFTIKRTHSNSATSDTLSAKTKTQKEQGNRRR